MFVKSWKEFTSSNQQSLLTSSFGKNFDSLSDYLSFPTFMEMFKGDITILNTLDSVSFKKHPLRLSLDEIFVDCKLGNLFNNNSLFNENTVANFDFAGISSYIEESSNLKNDSNSLMDVFPQIEDLVGEMDLAARYGEEELEECESTPDVRLHYPEPFVASPSFVHEEIWFIHILHYQHWLWFMFISIVMFYWITFINVVRWCNPRVKPKRETRGVSRSKCADLITACVPVSWAAAIIISETVDAADYYDGFGTGEIVIGIRAYQWGWEYFYPKGIDLNYNVKPSYSTLVGNSVKYNSSSSTNIEANSIWKSYQSKRTQSISSAPSYILLSPSSSTSNVNLLDFSKIGLSTLSDSSAFKKIQYFSKVNPQSLYTNPTLDNKYSKLHDLYLKSSNTVSSYNYGTMRQQNYTTSASSQYKQGLLDKSSVDTILAYNYNTNKNELPSYYNENVDLFNSDRINIDSVISSTTLDKGSFNNAAVLSDAETPTKSRSFLATTDSKGHNNSLKYSLDTKGSSTTSLLSTSDLQSVSNDCLPYLEESNAPKTFKFKDLKSPNLGFLSSEKNVRLSDNVNPTKYNPSLSSYSNNLEDIVSSYINESITPNNYNMFSSSSNDWVSTSRIVNLSSFDTAMTPSHTAVYSNNQELSDKSFDRYLPGKDEQTPDVLKSKEETAPSHLFTTYWSTYWSNIPFSHRINSINLNSSIISNSYLPNITEYAEYDFKNWQALELLEDAFWESTFSSFSQEEYVNILQSAKEFEFFKKQEELFNLTQRSYKFKNSSAYKPYLKSLYFDNSISNSLSLYTDDSFVLPSYLKTDSFNNLPVEYLLDMSDESFDAYKSTISLYSAFNKPSLLSSTNYLNTSSYTSIVDPFRADYEDQLWSSDLNESPEDYDAVSSGDNLQVANPLKLRSTTKNSMVTYSAIQKVFKSRLDEGRSHARLGDFSNSYISHPFVTSQRSPYESLLAKNKESFFSTQAYNNYYNSNFNSLFSVWNSLNSTFLDVPFLVSMTSDPSRYLWFDWKSRWSSIEIQPSSIARFSLSGVPYFKKSSEFDTQSGDELDESENYLNRLARARKNYLSSWSYTPYFYAKSTTWYKKTQAELLSYDNIHSTKALLEMSSDFWTSKTLMSTSTTNYFPTNSGVNTPSRSSTRQSFGVGGYYYHTSTLSDILSKREFIYRSYFNSKGYVANLPSYLTASPVNPLFEEVKSSYAFIDPVVFSSETLREQLYYNSNFIKFSLIKDMLHKSNDQIDKFGLNLSGLNNYLFFYMFGFNDANIGKNLDLFKSQYRPMRKGVTNMIRMQATGAIAMPIEIRLHILASSRDVIHSWAIPSAGIKIDCVPGYSSHRVAIFLVSGIFWGHCMEICGRFHHWMPIIVYFMKRDLFFLWCTHFMHYSSTIDMFDLTDKQLSNTLRLVSYDKTSWVNDINKIF